MLKCHSYSVFFVFFFIYFLLRVSSFHSATQLHYQTSTINSISHLSFSQRCNGLLSTTFHSLDGRVVVCQSFTTHFEVSNPRASFFSPNHSNGQCNDEQCTQLVIYFVDDKKFFFFLSSSPTLCVYVWFLFIAFSFTHSM